jgi:serine O-acetyltransferase
MDERTEERIEADWSRERPRAFWDPGRKVLKAIRAYQNASGPLAFLKRKLAVLRHRFWSAVAGCDIPLNTKIGGGLMIPHPVGIVIGPGSRIGRNCLIGQGVTLGVKGGAGGDFPILEDGADVSAGAKVLGAVTIGKGATVGANAVVLKDVPPGAVAVGVPARIIPARQTAVEG